MSRDAHPAAGIAVAEHARHEERGDPLPWISHARDHTELSDSTNARAFLTRPGMGRTAATRMSVIRRRKLESTSCGDGNKKQQMRDNRERVNDSNTNDMDVLRSGIPFAFPRVPCERLVRGRLLKAEKKFTLTPRLPRRSPGGRVEWSVPIPAANKRTHCIAVGSFACTSLCARSAKRRTD